jgi:hypothetical protein
MKILSFVGDVLSATTPGQTAFDGRWCPHVLRRPFLSSGDLDHVEKFVDVLLHFEALCGDEMSRNSAELSAWLAMAEGVVKANQGSML